MYSRLCSHFVISQKIHLETMATNDAAPNDGLPDRLTVPYILGLSEAQEATTTSKVPENREDLVAKLTANGVVVTHDDSIEHLQAAFRVMMHSKSSFWSKHFTLHPKQSRVKNWLWVHERYRNQAKALLSYIPNDESETADKANNAHKLRKEFDKFHGKIESHSEFEDNQLFKFFIDENIGNQDSFKELVGQHSDLRQSMEVKKTLEELLSSKSSSNNPTQLWKDKMKPQLEQYIHELLDHLQLEEQTITGPWLQLSDEEYKKYRTYLSWKYCFMY